MRLRFKFKLVLLCLTAKWKAAGDKAPQPFQSSTDFDWARTMELLAINVAYVIEVVARREQDRNLRGSLGINIQVDQHFYFTSKDSGYSELQNNATSERHCSSGRSKLVCITHLSKSAPPFHTAS